MFLVVKEIVYAVSTSTDTFWLVGAIPATTAISTARDNLSAVAASIATTAAREAVSETTLKTPRVAVIALVVIFILVFAAIADGSDGTSSQLATTPSTQATQPASQPTTALTQVQPTHAAVTPVPAPTRKLAPSFITIGDGTYQVGHDIQPGTYRTRVASPGCYYERLSGFSGSVSDIIANNDTDNPAIVTIKATDKGFDSQGCGTWTSDLSQITASKTSFDDGMYIVGTDITPGTYKNSGGSSCYYARLSGFGNTTDDIIANNDVTTPTIVSISASDEGFESQGCGTWTKI